MQKFSKRLMSACLAAVIAVSAASMPVWSESDEAAETAEQTDPGENSTGGDTGTYVTEEEAFKDMKLYAENSKLALYVDENKYTFVVEDKSNGYRWWASYYNNDPSNKTKISKRCNLLSVDVVGAESKTLEQSVRSYDSGISKTVEKLDNGVKFTFHYPKYDITVPLVITINDNGTFTATVPTNEIIENRPVEDEEGNPGYQLLNVHILENMGAAGYDKEGMMIVSDGSGAVINYNNGTATGDNNTYEEKVYGEDIAVGKLFAGSTTERITMPVMATVNKTDGAGLVMIATEGDMYSIEHAMVTNQNVTDLNAAWFEYYLRTTDRYFMGNKNEPLWVYESYGIKTGNVSTTYTPIYGNDLSYIDAVNVYRDYLINTKGVTAKTVENSAPYYLTLYGGTVKKQSVLGFPVNIQTAATTYKEALDIIQKLESQGVEDIKLIYEDFNEAGIVGEIAANFQYSGLLGGKNDYKQLKDYISSHGYEIFPSCDIMEFYKSGNGYSFTLNSSKQITKAYATQTPFELAFGLPSMTKDSWTILSPYYFTDIFDKLISSFGVEGEKGISLNQASWQLYSDFSRYNADGRNYFVRGDTIKILTEGYEKLKNSGMTVMTEAANQYVLPYADYIKDVPLYSSNYDIFDYDIPFVEMVLHGLIPYTTKAINKSADAEELRLLALVTGTPIHYELMGTDPNKFSDSEYDTLYYTNSTGWLDRSAGEYNLFNDIIRSVSNARITKYDRLNDHEIETTFDNGHKIYVNTETGAIRYDNNSYDVKDYGLGVTSYE